MVSTAGSASFPAPRGSSRAMAGRCRRSATWADSSRSYELPSQALTMEQGDHHFRNIVLLWLLSNAIMLPIVIWVLGPGLPPGNGTVQSHGQVVDNIVLFAIATPVAMAVLVYFGYALWAFRERTPDVIVDGPPIRGNATVQFWWLATTITLVLFRGGYGQDWLPA